MRALAPGCPEVHHGVVTYFGELLVIVAVLGAALVVLGAIAPGMDDTVSLLIGMGVAIVGLRLAEFGAHRLTTPQHSRD